MDNKHFSLGCTYRAGSVKKMLIETELIWNWNKTTLSTGLFIKQGAD
jgi:hypothetical protein